MTLTKLEKFWNHIAPGFRKYLGLIPPTTEEAQALFDAAEDEPLSEEVIESIIKYAKTGKEDNNESDA